MGDNAPFPGAVLGAKPGRGSISAADGQTFGPEARVQGYCGIQAFVRIRISLVSAKHQRLNAITTTLSTQTGLMRPRLHMLQIAKRTVFFKQHCACDSLIPKEELRTKAAQSPACALSSHIDLLCSLVL